MARYGRLVSLIATHPVEAKLWDLKSLSNSLH